MEYKVKLWWNELSEDEKDLIITKLYETNICELLNLKIDKDKYVDMDEEEK